MAKTRAQLSDIITDLEGQLRAEQEAFREAMAVERVKQDGLRSTLRLERGTKSQLNQEIMALANDLHGAQNRISALVEAIRAMQEVHDTEVANLRAQLRSTEEAFRYKDEPRDLAAPMPFPGSGLTLPNVQTGEAAE
jgi:chromosome segregation ATPase